MTSRNSRWFLHEPKMWLNSPQTYLLLDDFNLHLVPHRSEGDAYELSVCAPKGISSGRIKEAISLWDNSTGADSFVSALASTLLTEHEAWLEVIFKPDDRDGLPFRPLLVHGVRKTATGNLIQEMPTLESTGSLDYPHQGGAERQIETIELDERRMVHACLPAKYSSKLLKKLVEDLVEVDTNDILTSPWVIEKMTEQRGNAPAFDPSEATRTQRLRIAQAALPIGWTAREIYYGENRHLGEYYYYWRELRFLHFRSSMRERAEGALRKVLTLAGEECGFEAYVTARGLFTPTEVEGIISEYEAGEIPFSKMNDIIYESDSSEKLNERVLL